jgi:hypothetical protein
MAGTLDSSSFNTSSSSSNYQTGAGSAALTGEDVKPLSSFYSTALSPRCDSYETLATRIAYAMGYPMTNVEVHPNAIFDNISIACEFFAKYAGYTEEYLVFNSDLYEPGKGVRMDKLFTITPDMRQCYDTTKRKLATTCPPEDPVTETETVTGYKVTCTAVVTSTDGPALSSTEIICTENKVDTTSTNTDPYAGNLASIIAASFNNTNTGSTTSDNQIQDTSTTQEYDYVGDWSAILTADMMRQSLRQRIADLIAQQEPVCQTLTAVVTGMDNRIVTGTTTLTSSQPVYTGGSLAPILTESTNYNFTSSTTGTTGVSATSTYTGPFTAEDGNVYSLDPYDIYPPGPTQFQTITSTTITSDVLQVPYESIESTTTCTPVTSLTDEQLQALTGTTTTPPTPVVDLPTIDTDTTTTTKTTTGTVTLEGEDGTEVTCITSVKIEPTTETGTQTVCVTSNTTEQVPTTAAEEEISECLYNKMYDYDINDYRKVIDIWSFTQGTHTGVNTLFTLEQSLAQQTYFSYAMGNYGFDLVSWYAVKEWLELREKLLVTKPSIHWDFRTQYMRLIPEPRNKYYGVIACYVELPVKDLVKELWVYKYALALTKLQVGRTRSKFSNVPLIGGGTVNSNGDALLREGKEEKDELEKQMYEGAPGLGDAAPPMFFVG